MLDSENRVPPVRHHPISNRVAGWVLAVSVGLFLVMGMSGVWQFG